MLSPTVSTTRRASARLALAITPLAVLCLACLASVEGERAATGACPEGEVCSDATPEGLNFVGRALFDEEVLRLGPVLVGGRFDLGLDAGEGVVLPSFRVELDGAGTLDARQGTGTFGPTDEEGTPLYPVDAHVELRGAAPGTATVRIVDAATGELLDRMPIDVVAFEDVTLVNVSDTEIDYLIADCEQMVGVRLLGGNGDDRVRGFDEDMTVSVDGTPLTPEVLFWDCVQFTPDEAATEARFTIHVAGRDHVRTMAVRTLEDSGRAECPVRAD